MKYVLFLEDEIKIACQLAEAVYLTEPLANIRVFRSLDALKKFINNFNDPADLQNYGESFEDLRKTIRTDINIEEAKGKGIAKAAKRLAPEISEQILLTVLKADFFNKEKEIISLIKQLKELFIQKNVYNGSDPASFAITAFDSPAFHLSAVKDADVNNVFYKPFDRPILQQHMEFALLGKQNIKVSALHVQKTSIELEMLKEVKISNISDFGFTTESDAPLSPGIITRYYSSHFQTATLKSVMAVCLGSSPDTKNTSLHHCYFSYFGIQSEQLNNIRKLIKEKSKGNRLTAFRDFKNLSQTTGMSLIMIEDENFKSGINESLERTFSNCQITVFKDFSSFEEELKKNALPIDGFIFSNAFYADEEEAKLMALQEMIKKSNDSVGNVHEKTVPVFVLSSTKYSKIKEKEIGKFISDLFYSPFDRAYIIKKIALYYNNPKTQAGYNVDLSALEIEDQLKVANPVKVSEISEAHIQMEYYRAMKHGEFRTFLLSSSNENDSHELMGHCNFITETEVDKKKKYVHQFVFFGIKDSFLKFIRIWIRDVYIHSKEGSG